MDLGQIYVFFNNYQNDLIIFNFFIQFFFYRKFGWICRFCEDQGINKVFFIYFFVVIGGDLYCFGDLNNNI